MRPANVSELCRSRGGEALPRTRKRAGRRSRSASTRRAGKIFGSRCISSSTTSPRSLDRASRGSASWAKSALDSKSKKWVGPERRLERSRARVVLPTCRAPKSATTGLWPISLVSARRCPPRSIIAAQYHEIWMPTVQISWLQACRPKFSRRGSRLANESCSWLEGLRLLDWESA